MSRRSRVRSRTRSSASTQASAARAETNRTNAQHSTGPRTEEGKARVAKNAVKHGLYSQPLRTILKGKIESNFEDLTYLVDSFHEAFQPQDLLEAVIVDRLATQHWRLYRLGIERELFSSHLHKEGGTLLEVESRCVPFGNEEARLERSLSRQIRDLVFLQRWRMRPPRKAPRTPPAPEVPPLFQMEEPAIPKSSEDSVPEFREPIVPTEERIDAVVSETIEEPVAVIAPTSHSVPDSETAPESTEADAAAPAAPASAFGDPISERITPHGIHRTYMRDGITYSSTTPFDQER